MERIALEAQLRSGRNSKGELNRLRREDKVPAVVYGRGKDTTSILLDGRQLRQALSSEAGSNAIVELGVKNGEKNKETVTETVMFKDVQKDILVSERLLHIDFIRISLTEKILANVPLQITGDSEAPGVKEGGIMQALKREVEVYCLPAAIPDFLEVDISSMNIGDSLLVKDLELPQDIELETDAEETLVQVLAPQEEAEEGEEAEAAEAEAAEEETEEEASE